MKNFLLLRVLDRFSTLFKKLKIDYPVMRKILQVKLTMDGRRVSTMFRPRKVNRDKNYFLSSLWFYLFMGVLIIVPFVFFTNDIIHQMSIIFGLLMFLITISVISDFSSVILDVRDKTIILTKPVEPKTLSMAKFLHVFNYLFLVTIALVGPSIIALFIKFTVLEGIGYSVLFILLYILEIFLLDLFIIVLTTLLYVFILKFFNGDKLKDIINYVQIIMSISIAVMYQFVNRIFQTTLSFGHFRFHWYDYLVVPIWFGSPFDVLFNQNHDLNLIILCGLVLFIPILMFILYLKLIPSFEKSLSKLNQSSTQKSAKIRKWSLGKLITRNKEEYAFYRFGKEMMKSERNFKLKVYPSLGLSLIFPFIFLLNGTTNGLNNIENTKTYLLIYFCAFLLPTAVLMLKFSVNYKGSWVYHVTPIKRYDSINKGVLKAFIVRLLLPIYLLESVIFLVLYNVNTFTDLAHIDLHILPDLIAVFLVMLSYIVISYQIVGKSLPFSESVSDANSSQGMIVFLMMLIVGLFALVHFIFTLFTFGIYIYIGILLILDFITWKFGLKV